ncbi:MAG: sensor histidine kinase [Bacteroidota bacterium]
MQRAFSIPKPAATADGPLFPWTYQVGFWVVYTLFWHVVYSPVLWTLEGLTTSIIYTFIHVLVSYWNISWLLPRFWQRNRLVYLILLVIGILLGAGLLALMLYAWIGVRNDIDFSNFFGDSTLLIGSTLGSTFSAVMLTMGLFLLAQRRRLEQRQQQLEEARTQAELQFLRQQLDPHFLFNVLNNIYFLIKKDPDAAANALAGFSDLLRYQIYHTQTDFIPLHKEFEYLEQYAHLAGLRLPTEAHVQLQLADTSDGQWQIPPLLLLPLVENAYKHVDKDHCEITITGQVQADVLQFTVVNSKGTPPPSSNEQRSEHGIGLDNLQQRLDLLYPERHQLDYAETNTTFRVDLALTVAP